MHSLGCITDHDRIEGPAEQGDGCGFLQSPHPRLLHADHLDAAAAAAAASAAAAGAPGTENPLPATTRILPESMLTRAALHPLASYAADIEAGDGSPASLDETLTEANAEIAQATIAPGMSNTAFYLLILGLNVAIFTAALDQTIISPALQAIATEFAAENQVAWVSTAFLVTSTALVPLYGQLADIFGRKATFLLAIAIFEVGCAVCGFAGSLAALAVGRAVAGVGGAGIFSLVVIIIADVVPLRDRAKWVSATGAGYGLAFVSGPVLGGVLVDHASWRWVFLINLPLGAVAVAAVVFLLKVNHKNPTTTTTGPTTTATTTTTTVDAEAAANEGKANNHIQSHLSSFSRVDYLGALLLIGSFFCILVPLQGGGTQFAWDSAVVKALFPVGAVLLLLFVWCEKSYAKYPIVPLALFNKPRVLASFATTFFFGACFFGLIFVVPQWFQVVNGDSAAIAGARALPLILCVALAIFIGFVSSKTGIAWPFIPSTLVIMSLGVLLLGLSTESSGGWTQTLYLFISGLGGCNALTMVLLVGQLSVPNDLLSTVTSLMNFFQATGGVLGLAALSVVFNARLPANVQRSLEDANVAELHFLVPGVDVETLLLSPSLIRSTLPMAEWPPVVHGFFETYRVLFFMMLAFVGLSFCFSLFMKKDRPRAPPQKAEGSP